MQAAMRRGSRLTAVDGGVTGEFEGEAVCILTIYYILFVNLRYVLRITRFLEDNLK